MEEIGIELQVEEEVNISHGLESLPLDSSPNLQRDNISIETQEEIRNTDALIKGDANIVNATIENLNYFECLLDPPAINQVMMRGMIEG